MDGMSRDVDVKRLLSISSLSRRSVALNCGFEVPWLPELQKRNIRSSTILSVFNQFCYVPRHTVGEQLLQVREAKREQAAYESAHLSDR
jgi:hypothetical protein